jgi:hypothetical protein
VIDFEVYKDDGPVANIEPLSAKRDWMEATFDKHAYRCLPVTLTNQLGWAISFPEDITFMWDGQISTSGDHVKVLAGEKYIQTGRGQATVSFETGLVFRTPENYSLLTYNVPNMFMEGVSPYTTIISSSFFEGPLPVAWKITKPFVPITIKANQPVAAVFPISLTDIQGSTLTIKDIKDLIRVKRDIPLDLDEAVKSASDAAANGGWTDYYRNAIDYMGNKLGRHETKSLKLLVKDESNEQD